MTKQKHSTPRVTRIRANGHGSDTVRDTHPGLGNIDVAALAQLYNSPPASRIAYAELLEQARLALMKYELAEDELAIASDSLARSMHMLLEQHGLKKLEPAHMAALEKDVLDWCGILHRPVPMNRSSFPAVAPNENKIPIAAIVVKTQNNPLFHKRHGTTQSH